jgi:hypothetical protein
MLGENVPLKAGKFFRMNTSRRAGITLEENHYQGSGNLLP